VATVSRVALESARERPRTRAGGWGVAAAPVSAVVAGLAGCGQADRGSAPDRGPGFPPPRFAVAGS
jgi:hypothetical protein